MWYLRTKPVGLTVCNHMVFSTVWNRTGRSITMNPKVGELHTNTQYCHSQTAREDHPHPFSSFFTMPALHRVIHREETERAEKAAKYVVPLNDANNRNT